MKVRKDKDPGISATMTVLNTFVLSLRVNLLETVGSVALSAHYGLFCKMIDPGTTQIVITYRMTGRAWLNVPNMKH